MCEHAQPCLTLCDPMDCSFPGSSVHGIFRQKYWSRLPFPTPGDLPSPGIEPTTLEPPELAGRFFTTSATWEASQYSKYYMYCSAKSSQSCLTLCDPMDCSLLGFSVHVIFQAKIPGWVAIFFSKGSSLPRD